MGKTIVWTEDESLLLVRETRKLCPRYAWIKVADSMNQEMKRRHATTGVVPLRVYKIPGLQSQLRRLKTKRPELFEAEDDAEGEDDEEVDTAVGDGEQDGDKSHGAGSLVETSTQDEAMEVDMAEGQRIQNYPERTSQEFEEEEEIEVFEDQSSLQPAETMASNTDLEVIIVQTPVLVHPAETTAVLAASTSFPLHMTEAPFPAELKTDVNFARLDYADAVEEYNAYGAASATRGWSQQKFESLREAAALAFERKLEVEGEEEQYKGDNFEGWDFK